MVLRAVVLGLVLVSVALVASEGNDDRSGRSEVTLTASGEAAALPSGGSDPHRAGCGDPWGACGAEEAYRRALIDERAEELTRAWRDAWCEALLGMAREELIARMGEPAQRDSRQTPLTPPRSDASGDRSAPPAPIGSDTWEVPGRDRFNAFYDDEYRVQQLDGPAGIECAEIRARRGSAR